MKKIIPAIFCIFSFFIVKSQDNYQAGLIVKNNGDTVKGWIDYREWRVNPRKIGFRMNATDNPADQFTTADIRYFEIPGRDAYLRAVVVKDMRPVRPEEISPETRDRTQTDTVFLRILVKGRKLSLYELADFKEHFYLQEGGNNPWELLFKLYPGEEAGQVSRRSLFRDQLGKYLIEDPSPSLQSKVDRANYSGKDLSVIVIGLNGKEGGTIVQNPGDRSRARSQFFISPGVTYSSFHVGGDASAPLAGMNYKGSVNPALSVGVDLLSARNFNDFTFRFEVGYSRNSFKGQRDSHDNIFGQSQQETYEIGQQNISPAVSGFYNFHRSGAVRYFVGLGLAYNFSSYSKNRYTLVDPSNNSLDITLDNYLDIHKAWPSVFLRAGVRINRKFEAGLSGDVLGQVASYSSSPVSLKSYSARLAYFL